MSSLPATIAVLCCFVLPACKIARSEPVEVEAPTVALERLPVGSLFEVATVQFAPVLGDVEGNRTELVRLSKEAAEHGAKIIVHTEMATSGYAYFSREEISKVAETVPGPSTTALGEVAREYGVYIVFGMPLYDPDKNVYFNSAVLLTPEGDVGGVYKKRSNLLEVSYNAEDSSEIPTFDTIYGRVGIAICADVFYEQISRLAAVAGADILLAPTNSGVTTTFGQVRAYENNFHFIIANRYGEETAGTPLDHFTQDTFTIPSPFPYNFDFDPRSMIIRNDTKVMVDISTKENTIGYAELPVLGERARPVVRRPELYSMLAQDTLQPYVQQQLGLPPATTFGAAAVQPASGGDPYQQTIHAAEAAIAEAKSKGMTLRVLVLPADYFGKPTSGGVQQLQDFARAQGIDLYVNFGAGEVVPPESRLLGSDGKVFTYERTHRAPTEPDVVGADYWVVDRDYGRVGLLQGNDLLAPETSQVMQSMGVDVLLVNANSSEAVLPALWENRTGDFVHVIETNLNGLEGIYLGGYVANPSKSEGEGTVMLDVNTADVRNKKGLRFLDPYPLLGPKAP
ncbi:nitrilase-related carbon-nitrogen hydrolase [Paraliomyxa miuraensis]|uniref:nitrilase-related carbon-nitrogen hydrolase n=1 Tax=Paraliomyxa miuraensis TaxID=376150 RepID=UPI002255E5B3|nr:nitrilase-related carbon-nitrogen hydrolase [Paraliomyxa miuraensis]MCX4246373.1 hypothetical protein [Paraliomyxa miuraensis]